MKKRVISILLMTIMVSSMLAGCGKTEKEATVGAGTEEAGQAVEQTEEGKVINVYAWNDEFRQRVEAVYPEVKETSEDGSITTLTMERKFTGS